MSRSALAALACLLLVPASTLAAARPKFPQRYTGAISGTYSAAKDGVTRQNAWTIKDATFRLEHVRPAEGSWTGFYEVTKGTVAYRETETGPCTYSIDDEFALKPSMPKRTISTPFFMRRSLLSKETYDGRLDVTKKFRVAESCDYGDGAEVSFRTVEPPNFFDTGEARGKIGRALKGRFVYKDDFRNATTTWKWSLRPAR
jgi:hypothetical protein